MNIIFEDHYGPKLQHGIHQFSGRKKYITLRYDIRIWQQELSKILGGSAFMPSSHYSDFSWRFLGEKIGEKSAGFTLQ